MQIKKDLSQLIAQIFAICPSRAVNTQYIFVCVCMTLYSCYSSFRTRYSLPSLFHLLVNHLCILLGHLSVAVFKEFSAALWCWQPQITSSS